MKRTRYEYFSPDYNFNTDELGAAKLLLSIANDFIDEISDDTLYEINQIIERRL